ncbi:MAG: hypothetical protein EXQ86_11645 [Rhodospirillales bacterium]|nr:hypothetical protein [Rhodospirillales bacterium]
MASDPNFVIIGAGQAGGWAAATLRAEGFAGRVVIIGAESYPPHERPPLSKGVLAGDAGIEKTFLRPSAFYGEKNIELKLGASVEGIDCKNQRLRLAGGEAVPYDSLLLATGARVRRLPVPGSDLAGVHYLRTIDDMLAIRPRLEPGCRVAVVGGGYIGLEVAATARKKGCDVTVLEMQDVAMPRVVAPEIGKFYVDVHRSRGVDVRLGVRVVRLEGKERVERVVASGETTIDADLVVIGVGILADADLAATAGLAVENGIVVDEFTRTSDPHIFAAGDVANAWNPALGRRVRLESWQNAQNQAIAAAKTMAGKPVPYGEIPWFWSDQYDLNLQMVGMPETWDALIVRGAMGQGPFTAFYMKDGVVVGANAVNNARDIRFARKWIAEKRRVDADKLADAAIPLKQTDAS